LFAKRLSDGNSTDGRLRLLGSPGLEEKSGSRSVPAGNPVAWWHFAVEVHKVQPLMAVANPLKDGVQAVSTV